MTRILGYIAETLDGYIAETDGSYGFLDPYGAADCGYDAFYAGIGTLVMGRGTFEACLKHPSWPYRGRRSIVVTRTPPPSLPPDTEVWTAGVDALLAHLRGPGIAGDVWVLGGGLLQQAFLDRDAIDRLEIYVVPVILGDGIPLFPGTDVRRTLKLVEVARFGEIAQLVYERA